MRKFTAAALTIVALLSSATIAHAKGGRTSAADCEPGSPDPDCPDTPPAGGNARSSTPASSADHAKPSTPGAK